MDYDRLGAEALKLEAKRQLGLCKWQKTESKAKHGYWAGKEKQLWEILSS